LLTCCWKNLREILFKELSDRMTVTVFLSEFTL
jgi:hypothetical protein